MKIFKKTLAMLLSIIMVFGIMPASVFTASAEEASTCPVEGATGTGTEEDPIIVDTYEELKAAMELEGELYILIEEVVSIECLTPLDALKSKSITVNGTVYGNETVFKNLKGIGGNGSIISENGSCIVTVSEIKGNITFESKTKSPVVQYLGSLSITGGTFKTSGEKAYSLEYSTTSALTLSGGVFPNGIEASNAFKIELGDGCLFKYEDGTVSEILKSSRYAVEVVNLWTPFKEQTPVMPEGEKVYDLGCFKTGDNASSITFSFSSNPLPQIMVDSGYSISAESMRIYGSDNGKILDQNSGKAYTINNNISDRYVVIQTIELEQNGRLSDIFHRVFNVTISENGIEDIDPDCIISGASGNGTKENPFVVDNTQELWAAINIYSDSYIVCEGYIELVSTLMAPQDEVNGVPMHYKKNLIVNGILYSENNVINGSDMNLTIDGCGEIISENGNCARNAQTIKGDVTFRSYKETPIVNNKVDLSIGGGTFITDSANKSSVSCTAINSINCTLSLSGGSFPKGIKTDFNNTEVVSGYLLNYEDGTLSTTLQQGVPVEVYSLGFATQYPAMPEGETAKELGIRETGKNGILTVKFTPESLPQASIDAGYTIKEDLKIYDPTGKLIKSQASGASCPLVPEIEGEYRIVETLTLIDSDGNEVTSLTHTFTFTAENTYSISARISGVPEGKAMTINLYKAGEDTPFKTTTAYGQGYFDINSLPVDVAFTITSIPNGDYVVEIVRDNYVPYRRNITVNGKNFVDFFAIESYKTVVVDITGMYDTNYDKDIATVKIYEKGTATVLYTSTVKGNGSHIFAEVPNGKYTVEVSANGYKTKTADLYIYNEDSVKGVYFDMELDPAKIPFGFATQSPNPTADEITDGQTDLGLMNTLPTFSFTAKQLYFKYMDMGYSIKTQTQVKYSSGATETFDSTTWTCGNYHYGTNKVTQIVMLIDPDGNEVGRKTHTYTFTYAQLYFESRTPGVTNEQAAAGVSELGTLTTAPKFAFTAYPLSSDLTKEGYSQKVKMEAYQDGELVYSADNGNTYIHIYPGEGKVIQTITLIDPDGNEVGSLAHTYNFTVEFPEGTISLSSDFLTLAENSTHQLSATFAPESLADTLVWTSSNSAVATIDGNGKITAVRPGSALIKATLGNGATAYCAVLVTADDVKAYVGGIGLAEGEYLAQGSSIPTTVKPADNYAYLATVNGKLTLTLHNYSYSGMGTFTSKNAAYGIYSTQELKIVSEGTNTIGPMSAPVDRYTSYGIGKGDNVSITSDGISMLTIDGVTTGISSSRYVFTSGNVNIINVTSGITCNHAQSMGGANFQSGLLNISCTGTAISVTGNYIAFTGANVIINCKSGINLVRQGEITIDSGSLKMYASASGINVKSGQAMTVNGGTAYIEAVNNAIALEGALNVNGGSIVLISTDTASDDSYSAISGAGTLTLASTIKSVASTSSNYSTSSLYADSRRSTFDYVSFRDGNDYTFVKQPAGAAIKGHMQADVTWETNFKPVKLELITFDGTSSTTKTIDAYSNSIKLDILPDDGYYQIRAYYATNYYIDSSYIYVSAIPYTVYFFSDSTNSTYQKIEYGKCVKEPETPARDNKFFYGWLTPDGKVFDFSTPITEDLVLKAGWADIKVNGVAMPDGTYLGQYSGAVTTDKPSDHWAYYKDGVLTLYNFDSPYGAGIEFGKELTIISSGNGNAVSCIVSEYDYANLTIDGTATLNVGHEQWLDYAILVYNTIIFKCDTIVECLDYTAIGDAEEIIVDGADVKIYAYSDMYFSNTIYGCEAPITVLNGSLYLYCEGNDTNTDSYIANLDNVLVYASDSVDGDLTDDHIIKTGGEAYDLELYRQIKITSYNTVKFHVDGYAVLMEKVATGACIEKPLDSDYGNRVFLGWYTEDGSLYDFNTPVTEELSLYAKFAVVEPEHGDFDFENNIISGILPGTTSLDYYGTFTNPDYAWSYQTENGYLGTGTVANVVNGDEVIESYSILLYGDVNGDGWCDGMDAVLVSCIVNGMLSESDIGELAYRAADCNHDGVIDEADVDLLNQAGALLANVDQSKSAEVLLETSSAYVEYIELIDQTPEFEIEDETDAPEIDVETEDTTPEQNAKIDIFEMIINFIKSIFEMLLAFIPVPIK